MKISVTVRNLSVGYDKNVVFPVKDGFFREYHDYDIVESDIGLLDLSVDEMNELIKACNRKNQKENYSYYNEEILSMLAAEYTSKNVYEGIVKDKFIIFRFSDDTEMWNNGCGADAYNLKEVGFYLYKEGYLYIPFSVSEKHLHLVNWEEVFLSDTREWKIVTMNRKQYILYKED